jgi:hypothetical protein
MIRTCLFFKIAIFSLLSQASLLVAADQAPIGIVKSVQGEWTCSRDAKEITPGMMILPDDRVVTDGSTSGSVSILFLSSGQLWTKSCSRARPCEGSYRPATAIREETGGFWSFLSGYVHSEAKVNPIFAGSRSAERGPSNALLTTSSGQVSLNLALASVSPGRYTGEMILRSSKDARQSSPRQLQIEWNGNSDTTVAGLSPGLYSFVLSKANGEQLGSPVAILIVSAGQTQAQQTWAEVKRRTASWKEADVSTIDSVLLATLVALDEQQPGER